MRMLLMAMLALGSGLQALTLDAFDYKDAAAAAQAWKPAGESEAPGILKGRDGVHAASFPCRFSAMKDWRAYWDRELKADLSGGGQIVVRLKSPDPAAFSQAVLYFRAGTGWYRLPPFSVGKEWGTKVLPKSQAVPEDKPLGWDKVDLVRLALLPAAPRRDGELELAFLGLADGLPESELIEHPALPRKGAALEAGGGPLWIDDFEDGDLVNALKAPWRAACDAKGLGTTLRPRPLACLAPGADNSAHALGISGHFGKSRAPWPYALLSTGLRPEGKGADLSKFKSLQFMAKGDGKSYQVLLGQESVSDFGEYRAEFTAGKDWALQSLPLDGFAQPGWAKPVRRSFVDVTALQFMPAGMDDEDYAFEIDDLRLSK
jgi:hypothetical protein